MLTKEQRQDMVNLIMLEKALASLKQAYIEKNVNEIRRITELLWLNADKLEEVDCCD